MISDFVEKIGQLRPQLITFNGHSFDLPVIRYRAMVNRISAGGLHVRPYFNRYTDDALDLCDVLGSYVPGAKAKLDEASKILGLTGAPRYSRKAAPHRLCPPPTAPAPSHRRAWRQRPCGRWRFGWFDFAVLPNIITCLPLATAELLARAAAHEAGHAVAALHYELPLKEVLVRPDGTGATRYARSLGRAEAELRTIVIFGGPAAERDLFPFDSCADTRDLRAIDEMIERFGLDWGARRLASLRFDAQLLVKRLRPRIRRVAAALIERRRLSAEAVAGYAGGTVSAGVHQTNGGTVP